MNPNIDLQSFGGAPALPGSPSGSESKLIAPPRRVFSRILLPLLLLAGFAGMGAYAFRGAYQSSVNVRVAFPMPAVQAGHSEGKSSHRVEVNAADKAKVSPKETILFQAPGWIEPRPYPIAITSLQPGTVKEVFVIEGQHVTSGSLIAELVDDDAQLAVRQAKGELQMKQAELLAAKQNWENPTDLHEAISTAEATSNQLSAEKSRMTESLRLAELESQAGRKLNQAGFEPGLTFEKANTDQKLGRLNLMETSAKIALNSATLQAAKERLALRTEDRKRLQSAQADVATADTALNKAQLQLARTRITAPTSGTIMKLSVNPGMMLSPDVADGMAIATMYQPEMLQARVDVPLSEAARVVPGLQVNIRLEAMPDKVYRGHLLNIVPEADIQKNVLPVKVSVDDPDDVLRPEMISRVEFVNRGRDEGVVQSTSGSDAPSMGDGPMLSAQSSTAEADGEAGWLVPVASVHGEGDAGSVFVVRSDGRAHAVAIKIKEKTRNDMVSILGDLKIPDQIISWSAGPIADGARVKIQE